MSKEQPIYQPTGYDSSSQELVFEDSSNEQSARSEKSEDAIDIGELGQFDNSSVESSMSALSPSDLVPKSKSPPKESDHSSAKSRESVLEEFENSSPEESPLSMSELVQKKDSPKKADVPSKLGSFDSESPEAESLGNLDSKSSDLEKSKSLPV